jgi:hypothetical protein
MSAPAPVGEKQTSGGLLAATDFMSAHPSAALLPAPAAHVISPAVMMMIRINIASVFFLSR